MKTIFDENVNNTELRFLSINEKSEEEYLKFNGKFDRLIHLYLLYRYRRENSKATVIMDIIRNR